MRIPLLAVWFFAATAKIQNFHPGIASQNRGFLDFWLPIAQKPAPRLGIRLMAFIQHLWIFGVLPLDFCGYKVG